MKMKSILLILVLLQCILIAPCNANSLIINLPTNHPDTHDALCVILSTHPHNPIFLHNRQSSISIPFRDYENLLRLRHVTVYWINVDIAGGGNEATISQVRTFIIDKSLFQIRRGLPFFDPNIYIDLKEDFPKESNV